MVVKTDLCAWSELREYLKRFFLKTNDFQTLMDLLFFLFSLPLFIISNLFFPYPLSTLISFPLYTRCLPRTWNPICDSIWSTSCSPCEYSFISFLFLLLPRVTLHSLSSDINGGSNLFIVVASVIDTSNYTSSSK